MEQHRNNHRNMDQTKSVMNPMIFVLVYSNINILNPHQKQLIETIINPSSECLFCFVSYPFEKYVICFCFFISFIMLEEILVCVVHDNFFLLLYFIKRDYDHQTYIFVEIECFFYLFRMCVFVLYIKLRNLNIIWKKNKISLWD